MTDLKSAIDAALKDLIDQVPTMTVEKITLSPETPVAGKDVVARIDLSPDRYVLCRIRTDDGPDHARLYAARVIET